LSLSHQLYASLFTRLVSEYSTSKSTFYDESQLRNGLDLRYSKQVPGGRINIGTAIYDHRLRHESEPSDRSIAREELLLSDGKPVLLGNAFIQTETIVLTDVTGTVIYQLGFDYLLFIRGDFIEVQRIPGGLIQDGATVYARYTVRQPAAYHFTMRRKHFNISLRTLANHFEVYFNYSEQSYDNLKVTDKVVLDRFYRRVWGARLDKGILTMGAEWDNHQSSVMPYDMYFLFLALQGNAGSKLHYALHSSFRDIRHNQESDRQQYGDLGLRLNLVLSPSSRLAFDIAYRKQDGRQIELGLLTSRLELQTTYRRLSLVCGIENYSRDYLGEEVDVRGLYLRIVRKFQ
ncbi:MAG: hypothetical protein IH599_06585, partial [Bacteroidales bacterium]|nr:hypothetical protein [Bacteroidales bacterium]